MRGDFLAEHGEYLAVEVFICLYKIHEALCRYAPQSTFSQCCACEGVQSAEKDRGSTNYPVAAAKTGYNFMTCAGPAGKAYS